jgi:hypothetical protein
MRVNTKDRKWVAVFAPRNCVKVAARRRWDLRLRKVYFFGCLPVLACHVISVLYLRHLLRLFTPQTNVRGGQKDPEKFVSFPAGDLPRTAQYESPQDPKT